MDDTQIIVGFGVLHGSRQGLPERLCGLARVLRGNALAAMEDVPLWHERDHTEHIRKLL
jgi:hypothetical protein